MLLTADNLCDTIGLLVNNCYLFSLISQKENGGPICGVNRDKRRAGARTRQLTS